MDGITLIIEKIRQDALAQVAQINADAEAKIDQIRRKASEQIEWLTREHKAQQKLLVEEIHHTMKTQSALQNRNAGIAFKQAILDEVISRVLEELSLKAPEERKRRLVALLEKLDLKGDEVIAFNASDLQSISKDVLSEVNENLKSHHMEGTLKCADKPIHTMGGFLVTSSKYEMDYTFETLLKRKREELEVDLMKRLFDE